MIVTVYRIVFAICLVSIFSLNNDDRGVGGGDAGRGWRIGAEFTFHFAVAVEPGHVETFRNCYVKLFRF